MKVLTCQKKFNINQTWLKSFLAEGKFCLQTRNTMFISNWGVGEGGGGGGKVHVIAKFNVLTKFDESYQNLLGQINYSWHDGSITFF